MKRWEARSHHRPPAPSQRTVHQNQDYGMDIFQQRKIWYLHSSKGHFEVLTPCTHKASWSVRTEKLPVLLWGGSPTPSSKAHSFHRLNQPNGSQHSTKECPLLFTQINRYTHRQRTKQVSWVEYVWHGGGLWFFTAPTLSHLEMRRALNAKRGSNIYFEVGLILSQFSSMHVGLVFKRKSYTSNPRR